MKSYSQAGQDLFAYRVLRELQLGSFLDVGANHPIERNNTYGLEQIGWRGLCVDNDEHCLRLSVARKAKWICDNAVMMDWESVLLSLRPPIDYLSLDCDNATFAALSSMPLTEVRFRVATIEHDRYRFGDGPRDAIRGLMLHLGYDLLCADVSDRDQQFEDWWVDPGAVDMTFAEPYRCEGLDWKEVLRKGRA